jgi:hypothetical protein
MTAMTNTFVTHGGAANVRNRVEAAWINSHGTKVSALRKKFTRCGGDPINLAPLKLDKNTSRIVPGVSTGACWRPPYYTGITYSITIARNTDSRVAESIRSTQRKATTRLTSQAHSVFENSFAAQFTRSYHRHFTLITRTASCLRQLP